MRALSACILLIVLSASGGIWLNSGPGRTDGALEEIEHRMAALGMRKMLRTHTDHSFSSIVIGPAGPDELFDFRAQITLSGQTMPACGRVRGLCMAGPEQPECWELAYLEANGQPVDLADLEAGTSDTHRAWATLSAAVTPHAPAPLPLVKTAVRDIPDLPDPAPQAATPPRAETPPTARKEAPRSATHRVARPVINTRGGPGTTHAVITRLAEGASLALIERRDGWGRFIVLDGPAEGTKVWASLAILDPLGPEESL